MHPALRDRLAVQDQVFTSADAIACGYGTDEAQVHMARTRPSNTRRTSGLSIGPALPSAAFTAPGQPVVIPTVAIVQTAATYGLDAGVTAADQALRRGQATPEGLVRALDLARLGPGADLARATVHQADGRAESVGESRTRVLFTALGLPRPELQVELHDADGLAGRVDFLFRRQRTIALFDGLQKYDGPGRSACPRAGETPQGPAARPREVVRLVWSDLSHPERVWRLVQAAFARAAARSAA